MAEVLQAANALEVAEMPRSARPAMLRTRIVRFVHVELEDLLAEEFMQEIVFIFPFQVMSNNH